MAGKNPNSGIALLTIAASGIAGGLSLALFDKVSNDSLAVTSSGPVVAVPSSVPSVPGFPMEKTKPGTLDHPVVATLLAQGFRSVPQSMPAYHRPQMVTTGLLAQEGGLGSQLTFVHPDGRLRTLVYLGPRLAAREPIDTAWIQFRRLVGYGPKPAVHPGIGFMLLDTGLAQCAFQYLPNKYGVTATLEVSRTNDLPTGYVLLQAAPASHSGRKAIASGTLHAVNGSSVGPALMEGKVLMVEPKWMKWFTWALP